MDISKIEKENSELRIVNLQVWKDDCMVFRRDWDEEIRRNQYSASKSFTSIAVGIAQKEGLLSLDERICEAFSEDIPENPDENLQKATVRDLLTMALGQGKQYLMGGQRPLLEEKDWVKYVLKQPFTDEPGTKFLYNNAGPYLAGILVQRRSGCDLVEYLMPRLFQPLGIRRMVWETDPLGNTFGAGGLFLTVTEMAKTGLLLLHKGEWRGKRILEEEYVDEMSSVHIDNWKMGYGYLFWKTPYNGYQASGKYGQLFIVLPEKNAVVAINAESRNDDLADICLDVIVPQL